MCSFYRERTTRYQAEVTAGTDTNKSWDCHNQTINYAEATDYRETKRHIEARFPRSRRSLKEARRQAGTQTDSNSDRIHPLAAALKSKRWDTRSDRLPMNPRLESAAGPDRQSFIMIRPSLTVRARNEKEQPFS